MAQSCNNLAENSCIYYKFLGVGNVAVNVYSLALYVTPIYVYGFYQIFCQDCLPDYS